MIRKSKESEEGKGRYKYSQAAGNDEDDRNCWLFKKGLSNASVRTEKFEKLKKVSSGDESYDSRELRSLSSFSEDEISKKGYIGDNLVHVRKKKEKIHTKELHEEGSIKFHVVCVGRLDSGHRKNKCPKPKSQFKDGNNKTGKTVEKEGQEGEGSNNKPKRPYKPKRKANVSWRNTNNEQKDATEEDIIYEADQSEADDEQEHDHTQRKPKLSVRKRLPVSLRED
ncbi:hypothetical protein POM88_017173 [Heracleum sosnowskyi]|uniref:Uncharacterized protein n=1 Tax=Heracleum sosnowskyi TaxID=360622 RepID=A0AAD8MTN9_9APIA|nr:hypothetical protein POM88_017173 [Heracleum sosnowskyi]